MNTVLADPELRDTPGYVEDEGEQLPRILRLMNDEQKAHLFYLAQKKAWIRASKVQSFTDEEETKIAETERKHSPRVARAMQDALYRRHHWNSLRWFLFGGLVDIPVQQDPKRAWDPVDIPVQQDPKRAWDPVTNPFLKVRVRSFVWTQDEHDQSNPFKRLPDKDYLRLVSYAWIHEPLLATPKSRQLLMTWLFSSIAVHETLFRPAKLTAWISKKFDDANANVEKRIKPVAERLPKKHFYVPSFRFIKGVFECEDSGSIIRAMGEEAKGLRQYTFSWVFDDEAAFQEQASDIITAALPTINGGGRFTLVSSANGKEVFYRVISENDRIAVPAGI